MARYINPGYLIFSKNGSLFVAPFSLQTYSFTKQPVLLLENIDGDDGSGIAYFSISQNGTLVYIEGNRKRDLGLVWVDLNGVVTPTNLPAKSYNVPRISPDGSKIAIDLGSISGSTEDIWIYDIVRGSRSRAQGGSRQSRQRGVRAASRAFSTSIDA